MKKNIFGLIIALLGQGLLAVVFFVLLDVWTFGCREIQWLDFAVSSIVFWIWVLNSTFTPLDLKDPTQKGVGALGIQWVATSVYTVCALGFLLLGLVDNPDWGQISFPWQIVIQGIFLFVFIVMMFSSRSASDKTAEVYHEEKAKKQGKKNIKAAIQSLLFTAEDTHAPSDIVMRIRNLSEETRFITPDNSGSALMLDDKIARTCDSLIYALSNYEVNSDMIRENVAQLERDLQRRKSL